MLKLPTSAFALVKKLPAALSAALACLVLAGPAMAAEAGADSDADARQERAQAAKQVQAERKAARAEIAAQRAVIDRRRDRKSTRLNSSHLVISYAVFCL